MNEDFDVHVINTVQMIAAGHDCRIAAIDPENRSIRLEGCRDEANLARKLADVLDGSQEPRRFEVQPGRRATSRPV